MPIRYESMSVTVAALIAATGLNCGSTKAAAAGAEPNLEPATRAINALGLDLLERSGAEGNYLLSPYSIQTALAMTWAGADGVTHEEMQRVLHFPVDEEALHNAMAALRQALEAAAQRTVQLTKARNSGGKGDPLTLSVANRLFGQGGYAFREAFLALTRDVYAAPFETHDFIANADAGRRHINLWVEERTHDRIRELIPPDALDRNTRLVLVNAIHLQAPWNDPFPESATRPAPFSLRDGQTIEIPTMRNRGRFGFAQHQGFSVVTVPYLGGEIQFLILLPDPGGSLDEVQAGLDADRLRGLADAPRSEVILHLPKLNLEPPLLQLGKELRALGMTTAFDQPPRTANFDRMAPRQPNDYLRISEVFHKTFLKLDEEGTEAAAATAVSMVRVTSMPAPTPEPIEVRVDRPFMFAVQHRASGACLFLGRVVDPR